MTLIPISLPSGMYRNGTPYASGSRWSDGNLIRWHDGSLRPIGGWDRLKGVDEATDVAALTITPSTETYRDMLSYADNTGSKWVALGSNAALKVLKPDLTVADITPAGFSAGSNMVTQTYGYGIGPYGIGPYGISSPSGLTETVPVQRWRMDTWGENIVACVPGIGPIYESAPGMQAVALSNAPTDVEDIIVTDQRILMAISNDPELRTVIWSDRENNNEWTPTETNYAGSQRLKGDGSLIGEYSFLGGVLILSQTDAHIARYVGAPYVYGFTQVGEKCGPVSKFAVAETDRFVMWMGRRNFWMYDGTLKPVPCEVMDFLAKDFDRTNQSKINAVVNAEYGEIWWYYQSTDADEVDSYVAFNYWGGFWFTGKLARTACIDRGVVTNQLRIDPDGLIWKHELDGVQVDGYAITGPLELGNGDENMALRYVFIDSESTDGVSFTFSCRSLPTAADRTFGPFAYNNPLAISGVMGREIRMRIDGIANDWEIGPKMRFDIDEMDGGFR